MSDTTGLGKPRPLEPQTKASQDEAAYGASDAKCSSCTHFQEPNACDKVEGEIDPGGHSKYYERGPGGVQEEELGEEGQL